MTTYRHGALTIVQDARAPSHVLRALKQIDPKLFLEQQIVLDGTPVWCVVYDVGSDYPPQTILEWRGSDGRPIPDLTDGIIYRVQAMERNSEGIAARVIKANADRIEAKKRETQNHWADIGTDFERLMSPGHSALLPRGQYLRRSRDKQRAMGRRV